MRRIILLTFGMLLFLNYSFAQSHTWVGPISGNWSDAANWSPGVPGLGAFVKINGGATVTVDVNVTVASILQLGVGGTAGHLVIPAGITLKTSNRGVILLDAGSSFTINGTYETTNVDANYDAIRNSAGGTVTISPSGVFIANNVNAGHGITSTGTVTNNGLIQLQSISGQPGINIASGSMTNSNTGIISIEGPFTNVFALRGNIINQGTIRGNSTRIPDTGVILNDVTLAGGVISPGFSVGTLSFRSGFAPAAGVTYEAEIDKTGGSLTSDLIDCFVGAAAVFNISNLSVVVTEIGTDALAIGDIFTIFTTPFGYTGTFAPPVDFSATTIPMGSQWVVNYNANDITIEVAAIAPVSLLSFNAYKDQKKISLEWETATEKNNAGFELLRSEDGQKWEKIAWIEGNGTSLKSHSYTYSDNRPVDGKNFYQLKQIDFDGQFEMSNRVVVHWAKANKMTVFPNPTNGDLLINFEQPIVNGELFLLNNAGNLVKKMLIQNNHIDLSNMIPGVYHLKVVTKSEIFTQKIIIN